jgi:hypothetical protein
VKNPFLAAFIRALAAFLFRPSGFSEGAPDWWAAGAQFRATTALRGRR